MAQALLSARAPYRSLRTSFPVAPRPPPATLRDLRFFSAPETRRPGWGILWWRSQNKHRR
jgi:hypothetical protein